MSKRYLPGSALLVSFLCAATPCTAQVIPRANLHASFTDNLFQSHDRQSAWITNAFIDLDYVPSSELNLYYTGSARVFTEFEELFNHTHQAGLSLVRPRNERDVLYAGAEISLRLDRPLYDYRDFVKAGGYATAKVYLRPSLLTRSGYSLRYQEYVNTRDYSFVDQTLFAQASQFLPTRTTVQVRGELGLKSYTRTVDESEEGGESEESGESGENVSTTPARSGSGRHLAQLVSRLRVAQSLNLTTGLQLQYRNRRNVAGQSRYSADQVYNPDDDLFDDHYSYSGHEISATLKHLAANGWQLEVTGRSEDRHYGGRPALDLEGYLLESGDTRRDTRQSLSVGAERSIFPQAGWVREVRVQLGWLYSDIDTNDLYYRAAAQVFSTGIQLDF